MGEQTESARLELEPDAWHQGLEGEYYVDCPECGSAATLMGIVEHGRCNGYLERQKSDTDVDEVAMPCSAILSLELRYDSDDAR